MHNLIHYSSVPVEHLDDREYLNWCPDPHVPEGETNYYKPDGLWVSVDGNGDGWKDWIEREGLSLNFQDRLKYAHKVIIQADANILCISSLSEMLDFNETYKYYYQYRGVTYLFRTIHWDKVAAAYQGVIIAPYCYECRAYPDLFWYYGWDCASGAIWDVSAIEKIEVLK